MIAPARCAILAQTGGAGTFTTTEFDLPESLPALLAWGVLLVLLVTFVIWTYRRDTARLGGLWRGLLPLLRLGVVAGVVLIMLNPHERTQKSSTRPSQVAVVFDTSLSMRLTSTDTEASATAATPSRAAAVREAFVDSGLLDQLSQRHNVSVYTLDTELAGPHHSIVRRESVRSRPGQDPDGPQSEAANEQDWDEILRPRGLETRLGEGLQEIIGRLSGRTLSGVVVVTDGCSNAGVEPAAANQRARATRTRLVTVGVGGTRQPANIAIANVQMPTDVHIGDPFNISVFVQGQGTAGKTVDVVLLARAEGSDDEPTRIDSKEASLAADGVPTEVLFQQKPAAAGGIEYHIRAEPREELVELSEADNMRRRTVTVSQRQIHVLLIAGGPSRDYRFVRDMLFRHTGMELDVWLQTVDKTAVAQVSQDASAVLTEFPPDSQKLFDYDAIVAFDADWSRVPGPQRKLLDEWVRDHAGGLVFVAGPLHTGKLSETGNRPGDANTSSDGEDFASLRDLLPVSLNHFIADLQLTRRSSQPFPLELTADGKEAAFLRLDDDPVANTGAWKEFQGVYRSYPTAGPKDGATVLAHFTDPRAQTDQGKPILIAAHHYGEGRVMFVGSPELWRLRSVSTEYFNRFWTKAVRDVAQGRIKRGNSRGLLMLDRTEFVLGQTVQLRAKLYDRQLKPLATESTPVEIYDPSGRPYPPQKLEADSKRPGQFASSFRVGQPGTWRIALPIPDSRDVLEQRIEVVMSSSETDKPAQDVKLLKDLAADTGGRYLPLGLVGDELPDLLPDRSESVMIDERLRPLWDRQWVLFLIVGLLSVEWIIRKLLKLA